MSNFTFVQCTGDGQVLDIGVPFRLTAILEQVPGGQPASDQKVKFMHDTGTFQIDEANTSLVSGTFGDVVGTLIPTQFGELKVHLSLVDHPEVYYDFLFEVVAPATVEPASHEVAPAPVTASAPEAVAQPEIAPADPLPAETSRPDFAETTRVSTLTPSDVERIFKTVDPRESQEDIEFLSEMEKTSVLTPDQAVLLTELRKRTGSSVPPSGAAEETVSVQSAPEATVAPEPAPEQATEPFTGPILDVVELAPPHEELTDPSRSLDVMVMGAEKTLVDPNVRQPIDDLVEMAEAPAFPSFSQEEPSEAPTDERPMRPIATAAAPTVLPVRSGLSRWHTATAAAALGMLAIIVAVTLSRTPASSGEAPVASPAKPMAVVEACPPGTTPGLTTINNSIYLSCR